MIDFGNENAITLREAARQAPGQPHVSTLHRWRRRGIRGVCLETCLVGGKRFTSKEALDRFFQTVTAVSQSERLERVSTKSARREKQVDQAARKLGRALGCAIPPG
jgi:DNA-binding sugar fermentation-stimulating protein